MSAPIDTTQYSPQYLAEDHGSTLIAICVLFIVLDIFFIGLRFYGQSLTRAPRGLDDLIILIAWFTHVGLCILGITFVYNAGVGRHLVYVLSTDPDKLVSYGKSIYALEWLYLPSVALSKVSILLFYLRIFNDRRLRIAIHVLICVLIANWFTFLTVSSLECRPIQRIWDKSVPGKCINRPAFWKSVSAPNILTDLMMFVLPLKTLTSLQISKSQKWGVIFIFASASVGIIAACLRMVTFFGKEALVDITWTSVRLIGWTIAEPGMYIIAACSVKLRPIIIKFVERAGLVESQDQTPHPVGTIGSGGVVRLGVIPSVNDGYDDIPIKEMRHSESAESTRA